MAELDFDAALKLAFHESFHELAQATWRAPAIGTEDPFFRADSFPLQWKPRYLRLQLLRSLQAALSKQADLSAAAHWLARYRAEAPAEAAAVVPFEIREGTARYVEAVSGWLARDGCDLPEADLIRIAGQEAEQGFAYAPRVAFESYSIGATASLLLRARRASGWQQRVADGESPLAVLLDEVEPTAQLDDAQRIDRMRTVLAATNAQLSETLAPFLRATSSKQMIRVGLAGFAVLGSYDALEALRCRELPGDPIVFPAFTGTLTGADSARARLSASQPFFPWSSPCGSRVPTVLIPAAHLRERNGVFAARIPGIELSNIRGKRVEQDGFEWVCTRSKDDRAPVGSEAR